MMTIEQLLDLWLPDSDVQQALAAIISTVLVAQSGGIDDDDD